MHYTHHVRRAIGAASIAALIAISQAASAGTQGAARYRIEPRADRGPALKDRYNDDQLALLEKLNRSDRAHLARLQQLTVPVVWSTDELDYSPLPQRYEPGIEWPTYVVVYLPGRGIVASGDLVGAPVPFAFGSHPGSWVKVLDSLIALKPRVIVLGHGPVQRDLGYVRSVRDWLARIVRETSAARARGDSLSAVLKKVTLDDVRVSVTKDEKWLNFLFRSFFVRPAVQAAYGT